MLRHVSYQEALDYVFRAQVLCARKDLRRPAKLFVTEAPQDAGRYRHLAPQQGKRLLFRAIGMLLRVLRIRLVGPLGGRRRERLTRSDSPDHRR